MGGLLNFAITHFCPQIMQPMIYNKCYSYIHKYPFYNVDAQFATNVLGTYILSSRMLIQNLFATRKLKTIKKLSTRLNMHWKASPYLCLVHLVYLEICCPLSYFEEVGETKVLILYL